MIRPRRRWCRKMSQSLVLSKCAHCVNVSNVHNVSNWFSIVLFRWFNTSMPKLYESCAKKNKWTRLSRNKQKTTNQDEKQWWSNTFSLHSVHSSKIRRMFLSHTHRNIRFHKIISSTTRKLILSPAHASATYFTKIRTKTKEAYTKKNILNQNTMHMAVRATDTSAFCSIQFLKFHNKYHKMKKTIKKKMMMTTSKEKKMSMILKVLQFKKNVHTNYKIKANKQKKKNTHI